jgi:hypothetical protein
MSIREVPPITPGRGGVSDDLVEAGDMNGSDGLRPGQRADASVVASIAAMGGKMPPGEYTGKVVDVDSGEDEVRLTIRVGKKLLDADEGNTLEDIAVWIRYLYDTGRIHKDVAVDAKVDYLLRMAREAREGSSR